MSAAELCRNFAISPSERSHYWRHRFEYLHSPTVNVLFGKLFRSLTTTNTRSVWRHLGKQEKKLCWCLKSSFQGIELSVSLCWTRLDTKMIFFSSQCSEPSEKTFSNSIPIFILAEKVSRWTFGAESVKSDTVKPRKEKASK